MTVAQVNYINFGLISLSLAGALIVPFELFLLAYAIIGPLHYLTEISWLHDRGYFVPCPRDAIPLWTLGIAGTLFLPGIFSADPLMSKIPWIGEFLFSWRFDIPFLAFSAALILIVTEKWTIRLTSLGIALLILNALRSEPIFIRAFASYLPSIVHVFVFTGLFMLLGALKGRSRSGYLTFAAFLVAAATACLAPGVERVTVSGWAAQNFAASFQSLTASILTDFGGMPNGEAIHANLLEHPKGIAAVRFLGFVYTYHYLNWFSKTSIIKWHQISMSRYALIVTIWAASIALYWFDYALGLSWLFFLSFGHVVLEFPLNHRSVHGIATELRARID